MKQGLNYNQVNAFNDNNIRRWIEGIPYEVAFWRSFYGNKKKREDLFRWSKYNKPYNLENLDINAYVRGLDSTDPLILDVGCSLSYMLGNIIDGIDRKITYVDPLATFYNDILRRYNISRPHITFGMIESLSLSFGEETADFIHVRNALDHCADPLAGIIQCLQTLKTGRVLYLNHHPNEAEGEAYRGFHQFNIVDANGELIIWNKEQRINVSEILGDFAEVEVTRSNEGNVVAVITKRAAVPRDMQSDVKAAAHMAGMLMTTMSYHHAFGNSLKYQFKRLYTSVGHRLVKLMPYRAIAFLKRLLARN